MIGSSICRSSPQEAFSERLPRSTTKSGGIWEILIPWVGTGSRLIRHVQERHGLAFGRLAAPVVARRGLDVGVAGQPLHGGQVGAGVEQQADERAPQIVGGEVGDLRL